MTIHLPEDLDRFVQAKIQTGRFASEDAAIIEAVRLLQQSEELTSKNVLSTPAAEPAWQRVLHIMGQIPDTELDRLPADGAEQLDHYIYGTPKRPNP